jgi:hypothetical protein
MSGVFQNIDSPSPPGECVCVPFGTGGGHTRWVERRWGVNMLKDARHCIVLYIRKYFVLLCQRFSVGEKVFSTFPIVHPITVLNLFFMMLDLLARSNFVLF